MMMVSQAVGDFLVGDLGVSPAAADRVMQLSAAYPESGVQGRLAQLRFGVSKSILSTDEAASLATEQPWFSSAHLALRTKTSILSRPTSHGMHF